MSSALPDPEACPLMSVPDAGKAVGWSRDQSYRAARDGIMPVIKMGSRSYVPTAEWRRVLSLESGGGDE